MNKETAEKALVAIAQAHSALDACEALVRADVDALWTPREYAVDIEMTEDDFVFVEFGIPHPIAGTGIADLPETAETSNGVEFLFLLKHVEVHADDAPNFAIQTLNIGIENLWQYHISKGIPATRFTADKPLLSRFCPAHQNISMGVIRTNKEGKHFRARVIGKECAPPVTRAHTLEDTVPAKKITTAELNEINDEVAFVMKGVRP